MHIETATEVCSVALSTSSGESWSRATEGPNQHSAQLTILIDSILQDAGISFAELSAVSVSTGPGSYTGLRVGMAAAKAFCFAHTIPLIGVSSLESIANGMESATQPTPNTWYIPMIDARRMEVYMAIYNQKLEMVESEKPCILTEAHFSEEPYRSKQLYFAGSGAEKFKSIATLSNARFLPIKSDAQHQVHIARKRWREKSFLNLASCTPNYIKSPNITSPKR